MKLARAASVIGSLIALSAGAQAPPQPPKFDPAAVERGRELLVAQCGFCHGSNARGGNMGSDLTRSALVQEDENGKQLGEFLKVGRPERNMPKFELTEAEEQRMRQIAADRLSPTLDWHLATIRSGASQTRGWYLLVVPRSSLRPHLLRTVPGKRTPGEHRAVTAPQLDSWPSPRSPIATGTASASPAIRRRISARSRRPPAPRSRHPTSRT